jgi:non-ribosomal peptide synthetase component F
MLGILKAGGAYVPIDPGYPNDHIDYMLEDVGSSIIVSSSANRSKLSVKEDCTVIELDRDWIKIKEASTDKVLQSLTPAHLAYVIYTSGSTGKPKGVMIEHQSLMNFIFGMKKILTLDRQDHLLAITSVSFDISILELFWTICNGIQVTIKSNDTSLIDFVNERSGVSAEQMDFSLFYFPARRVRVGINMTFCYVQRHLRI